MFKKELEMEIAYVIEFLIWFNFSVCQKDLIFMPSVKKKDLIFPFSNFQKEVTDHEYLFLLILTFAMYKNSKTQVVNIVFQGVAFTSSLSNWYRSTENLKSIKLHTFRLLLL